MFPRFFFSDKDLRGFYLFHWFYRMRSIVQIFSTNLAQRVMDSVFGLCRNVDSVWVQMSSIKLTPVSSALNQKINEPCSEKEWDWARQNELKNELKMVLLIGLIYDRWSSLRALHTEPLPKAMHRRGVSIETCIVSTCIKTTMYSSCCNYNILNDILYCIRYC